MPGGGVPLGRVCYHQSYSFTLTVYVTKVLVLAKKSKVAPKDHELQKILSKNSAKKLL